MDIKEYISSGIIEAYVMGLASEEEVRILDCIQKHNAEVRQAVLEAQSTLEDFASREAIAPPPALKSAIWAKISEEQEPIAIIEADDKFANKPLPLYPSEVAENGKAPTRWFAIAASVLLVTSISLNFYQNNAKNTIKNELAALNATQRDQSLAYNNLKNKWDLMNTPTVKSIPLLGVAKHPDMKAMVFFEQESKNVYLTLENLPLAPENQQYQLWAIVDGKPISLGVFDQNITDAVQQMSAVNNAQAFAITLEKRGGTATPTMENMYVMGKV